MKPLMLKHFNDIITHTPCQYYYGLLLKFVNGKQMKRSLICK